MSADSEVGPVGLQPAAAAVAAPPTPIFALAAFSGSFLLFLIQPMAAKKILPLFGGAAAVWTASLLFFQAALFIGYAYAAVATRRAHLAALALAACSFALPWTAPTNLPPVLSVFLQLASGIGAPFVVLAAGSTLLQRWAGTYSLYAISNAGSLLALLAYPILVEPLLPLDGQRKLWLFGGLLYLVLMAVCVAKANDPRKSVYESRPEWKPITWWVLWSACGSALLAAVTNQICQEVASIPFLWILPLAIYLVSFIVTFQSAAWRNPAIWGLLAPVAISAAVVLFILGPQARFVYHLIGDLSLLVVCLMLCHGELASSRPAEESLGWFYVAMSAGGVLGGLFTAVIAPLLLSTYLEFPLIMSVIGAAALLNALNSERLLRQPIGFLSRAQIFALATAAVIPIAVLTIETPGLIAQHRNFYGVLRVSDNDQVRGPLRSLTHGQTLHGTQWLTEPGIPTTYYNENSGVAVSIRDEQRIHPRGLKAGLIGLGAGTLAHYARSNDWFRFYEINPAVPPMARKYFTYIDPAKKIDIVLGDARLQMSREAPQQYDILVVDAFSSDSIPVHLLTSEAADLYATHVKPEGEMIFHISNRALNLLPVVQGISSHLHRKLDLLVTGDQSLTGGFSSQWVRLSPGAYQGPRGIQWTDAYSSLWRIVKIR